MVVMLVVCMPVDPSLRLDRIGIHPIPMTVVIYEVELGGGPFPHDISINVIRNMMSDHDVIFFDLIL